MTDDRYAWQTALKRALRKNRGDAHNRYLQLATLREDDTPAVRTLVYRGLRPDSDQILMVTDARSEKAAQITARPESEICWYLTRTREQFRLRGRLRLFGPEDPDPVRRELWTSLSPAARRQFFWPEPGAALTPVEPVDDQVLATPPPAFLGLALDVSHVDHLCLKGDPQTRWRSVRAADGRWRATPVNP